MSAWRSTSDGWISINIPNFNIPRNFACIDETDEGIIVKGGTQHEPPKPQCHFSAEILDQNHPEKGWSLIEHDVDDRSLCETAYLCYDQKPVQIMCSLLMISKN